MSEDTQVYELVAKAFAGDRMTMPMTEIERRAQRRRGRWVPAMAAVVVVVMLAGFAWWQRAHRTQMTTLDSVTVACMRHWSSLQPTLPAEVSQQRPTKIFSLGTGENVAHIYSNGDVLLECLREGDTIEAGSFFHADGYSAPPGRLRYFGHYGRLSYLAGALPEGVTEVTARLSNGDVVQAEIAGKLFALWHPHASLINAVLTATGPKIPTITADHPTDAGGIRDDASLDATCRSWMDDEYSGHPVTGLRLIYQRDLEDYQFRAYISDWTMFKCTLGYHGNSSHTGFSSSTPEGVPWSQLPPLGTVASGSASGMWYFGRAPKDATRVELYLSDGTMVPAQLSGGFFFALTIDLPMTVRKTVGYTPTTIYTWENRVLTSKPAG